MSKQLADVTPLKGLVFVSESGNVAKVSMIGAGAIHIAWKNSQTQEDIEQFNSWVGKVLGVSNPTVVNNLSRDQESEAYRSFLKGSL